MMSRAALFDMSELSFGVTWIRPRAEDVRLVERLGVSAIWVGGHVAGPSHVSEPIVQLAQLSACPSTVAIGAAVVPLPLYSPAVVAKQVAEIEFAAPGRTILGVGSGGDFAAEFDACQVPPSERGARSDEAIPLLRRLWSGEPVTSDGRFYAMSAVTIHPRVEAPGRVPIVVAGRGNRAVHRAALVGDGWMPYMYSPRRYAEAAQQLRCDAAKVGRQLTAFAWMLYVNVAIADRSDHAHRSIERSFHSSFGRDLGGVGHSVAIAGDLSDVIARFKSYVEAGARHFIVTPCPRESTERIVGQLRDEVFPELRRGFRGEG